LHEKGFFLMAEGTESPCGSPGKTMTYLWKKRRTYGRHNTASCSPLHEESKKIKKIGNFSFLSFFYLKLKSTTPRGIMSKSHVLLYLK
jgi:hypothetical protein